MRAALLSGYHARLELVERPDPEPRGPRDVVVRIGGAGVCATDLHAIDGLMGAAGVTVPLVLGHENAGWVHAAGDAVTAARVGDAVLLYPPYSCGLCVSCRRGLDMNCERHQFTGLTRDGGFADFVLVDERSLVPLPDGIDPRDVAPHADAGITAYHAVKKLVPRLAPGATVAVLGVGGVGHIALQLLRALGAATVIAVDTDERRRALGRELGADEVMGEQPDYADAVREATDGSGADVVVDFVGTDQTHAAGLRMLARRGLYSVVGYGGTLTVPSVALVASEQSIAGNLVGSWIDLWELLQLHAQGKVTLRSESHPLDAVNDVLDALRAGDITGRAVLVP
ncbi:MAG TPA: NAD(P)-dependent alcohol dehydrogenase [Gaiellaceae bacterium]